MRDREFGSLISKAIPRYGKLLMSVSGVALAMSLMIAPQAHADEEAETSENLMFEKVTVTAQKREQDPQDVGIAITALNGDQLEALGYTNAQDIAAFSPGVVSVQPNGEGSYSFAIRGVANNDLSTNVESPVAVYVDEVYISQMSATGFLLFDIDQAEVLRGPQGTLFGRNATGGLVQYTTVKPQKEFGGFGNVSYGQYDDMMLEGAVNIPLNDWIYARISAAQHTSTGYITNREHPEEKLNNNDDYAIRFQLLMEPTDDLSILLNARVGGQQIRTGFFEYKSAVDGGGQYTPGVLNEFLGNYEDTDNDVWAGDYDTRGHNISDTEGYTATVKWDVGNWKLTSITDYQTNFRDYIEDTDATPVRAYEYFQTNDAEQFSQELRAATQVGPVDFVAGIYYMDLQSKDSTGGIAPLLYIDPDNGIFEEDVMTDPTLANGDRTPSESSTKSASIFAQGEYAWKDFTFIGGLRYIQEKRDFISAREDVHFDENATSGLDPRTEVIYTYSTFDPAERDFDMWSWRLQANWQPTDDLLTYISYNRGVKSGGFSQPPYDPQDPLLADPALLSYEPEELDAYEIGAKWDAIPGKLRINGAAYYYDYGNYQAYTAFPGSLGDATINAQAKNKGAEVEIQAAPIDGLTTQLGVGYADIKVTDVLGFEGMTLTSVNSPEWNINGLIRYEFPVGSAGNLALQADAQYQSEHYFGLDVTPATTENGYTVANVSATWMPADANWKFGVSVENVFNEEYIVQTFDLSDWIGMIEEYYGKPRWVRAKLSWEF